MKMTVEEEYEKVESRKLLFDTFQQRVSDLIPKNNCNLNFFVCVPVAVLRCGKSERLERQEQFKHGRVVAWEKFRYTSELLSR